MERAQPTMEAAYVFGASLTIQPAGDLWIEPDTFETRLYRPAAVPGESGWRYFRESLWRGELGDPSHVRAELAPNFPADLESVEFRAFETDEEHLDRLKEEIGGQLETFNAESVREVLYKYFGSTIEVR